MPTVKTATAPKTNAQVAKATLQNVAKSGSFKPVTLTTAQLNAFGKKLATMAKTDPEKASKLLQRTLDLYGADKLKVKSDAPFGHAGRNDMANMANNVIAAIQKSDPSVATPAPLMLMR